MESLILICFVLVIAGIGAYNNAWCRHKMAQQMKRRRSDLRITQ